MEAETTAVQTPGETLKISAGIIVIIFRAVWGLSAYLFGAITFVLSYVLYPVVLLGRLLAVLLMPLWLIGSWTVHVAVVVPAQFLSKFEILYVFLTTALTIGVTTGVILRFSTSFIVSVLPDLPDSFPALLEGRQEEDYEDEEENEILAEKHRERRLLEALGRAEMVGKRREKERIKSSSSDIGSRRASSGGSGSGSGSASSSRDDKGSGGKHGKGSPTSGSNVLKETILEEESSAEWDS